MSARALAAAALLALCAAASAHEVRSEIVRGRAIAVRAVFAGGEPLAYCEYQVFAPVDPKVPWQKGRTDRDGWVAFVPTAPGTWRVKVVDATGHGLEVEIPAEAPPPGEGGARSAVPGLPRAAAGAGVILLAFGALLLVHRLRKARS